MEIEEEIPKTEEDLEVVIRREGATGKDVEVLEVEIEKIAEAIEEGTEEGIEKKGEVIAAETEKKEEDTEEEAIEVEIVKTEEDIEEEAIEMATGMKGSVTEEAEEVEIEIGIMEGISK